MSSENSLPSMSKKGITSLQKSTLSGKIIRILINKNDEFVIITNASEDQNYDELKCKIYTFQNFNWFYDIVYTVRILYFKTIKSNIKLKYFL